MIRAVGFPPFRGSSSKPENSGTRSKPCPSSQAPLAHSMMRQGSIFEVIGGVGKIWCVCQSL